MKTISKIGLVTAVVIIIILSSQNEVQQESITEILKDSIQQKEVFDAICNDQEQMVNFMDNMTKWSVSSAWDTVRFGVQIGAYKDQIPVDVLTLFIKMRDVKQIGIGNGIVYYTSGEFKTYEEAENHKKMLIDKGIKDVFVVVLGRMKFSILEKRIS